MKIRSGWVSNSSTTSFALMGERFDVDELAEHFGLVTGEDDDDEDKYEKIDDTIDEKTAGVKELYTYTWWDGDCVYVGVEIDDMKDDETKAQFRERVRELIRENLGLESKPDWIVESITDG